MAPKVNNRRKKIRTKTVRYGPGEQEFFLVRPQGIRVRMQDQNMGKPYALDPEMARSLARALQYAAHHAERPELPPELKEMFDAHIQAGGELLDSDGPGGDRSGDAGVDGGADKGVLQGRGDPPCPVK